MEVNALSSDKRPHPQQHRRHQHQPAGAGRCCWLQLQTCLKVSDREKEILSKKNQWTDVSEAGI